MSLEWKLVARGGAARQVTYPCAKCAVCSGQLHIQSQPTHSCVWCQELGHHSRPNWVCRHHRICTKNFIAEVRKQADSLEKHIPTKLSSLEETWMASNLTHSEDPKYFPLLWHVLVLETVGFERVHMSRISYSALLHMSKFVMLILQMSCNFS